MVIRWRYLSIRKEMYTWSRAGRCDMYIFHIGDVTQGTVMWGCITNYANFDSYYHCGFKIMIYVFFGVMC